ncbi:MAG: TolC family outer membrane protein [Legionella sp.]|nr:TolC family outer membrane protein [Legionella sp.]
MKKIVLFCVIWSVSVPSSSADLMNIFQQALDNDNIYQQAVLETLSQKEDVAISRAYLLPNAQLNTQPLVSGQSNSGAIVPEIQPPRNTFRSYEMNLSLTQPIFNFALFSRYKTSKISARVALAHLNSELQELMLRVTEAYFNVLRSEKRVTYLKSNKKALAQQLQDVQHKLKAGKTTQSYVYIAQSSYSAAQSDLLSAETQLDADKEYLTELTATDDTRLADLNRRFPLVSPQPQSQNKWLQKALENNWAIKANQLQLQVAREKIKQTYSDHMPVINAKLIYDNNGFHYTQSSLIVAAGSSRMQNSTAMLDVKIPIFSGGLVVASTRKAQQHFKIAQQKLDHSLRQVRSHVHNSYRNVIVNIKKIHYQSDAIHSAEQSLKGLKERYTSGSGNLTDVLAQQANLLKAQMNYETARYDYVISLLQLKKASGVLATQDLITINQWLHQSTKSV